MREEKPQFKGLERRRQRTAEGRRKLPSPLPVTCEKTGGDSIQDQERERHEDVRDPVSVRSPASEKQMDSEDDGDDLVKVVRRFPQALLYGRVSEKARCFLSAASRAFSIS